MISKKILRVNPAPPYKMIDLCSGIGGIRRAFELTGGFQNILSAEIDKSACATYEHLFGENPYNDLTSEEFKNTVENTEYHVLLSGFPCQPFSRSGSRKGFNDIKNGKIFLHIADIIERTRPSVIFLENVDYLVYHNKGSTFKSILEILIKKLKYKIIGASLTENDEIEYDPKKFIRNSKDFGVPQNRPRTYIIGFDTERFMPAKLNLLPDEIPRQGNKCLYHSINEMLDTDVDPKYYVASGYLETLKKHREREKRKGHGFGYKIVNEPGIERPIANTLLAVGGSGKERNLIYDPRKGVAGRVIKGKKTPLNSEGVRVMTPNEWGKLQGFVNYAFLDEENLDLFSFPDNLSDSQRYKQLGNSVTIPLVEEMARFILECLKLLSNKREEEI